MKAKSSRSHQQNSVINIRHYSASTLLVGHVACNKNLFRQSLKVSVSWTQHNPE